MADLDIQLGRSGLQLFPKCRRSVFRQIDLSRQSRTTKQICPFGILRLAMRPHRIAWRSAKGTHSARETSTATDVGRASQKGGLRFGLCRDCQGTRPHHSAGRLAMAD